VGALYGAPAGAATGALLGQYKRENPGDPNQAAQMALLGGLTGAASSAIGGQNPFFGTGLKGGGVGITDLFKSGGLDKLTGYFKNREQVMNQRLLDKAFGKDTFDVADLQKMPDVYLNRLKDAKEVLGVTGKGGKGLGTLGSLGTLAGGLGLSYLLGSQIPKPEDAVVDPSKIRQPERTDDFAFAPNQTYTRPEIELPFAPATFAAKGGVMDLQDGGESKGPGTGTSDSIPAMLSDGEFVMTAKAVRGAGGGDRREGARKMYEAMDKLEAQA
jgi:hypothetical protein